jgi:hypothetical protein
MFTSLIALMVSAAAMQADPVNDARRAYSNCMRAFMRTSLQAHTEPAAFETAMATTCTAEATAYRTALVRRDRSAGGSAARAEEDATMMIDDTKANTLEYYRDYFTSNTIPPA